MVPPNCCQPQSSDLECAMNVESQILPDPAMTERLKSSELRESFLVERLFKRGRFDKQLLASGPG